MTYALWYVRAMVLQIFVTLLALLVPPDDVQALISTAPQYLTQEAAREHLAAARVAGWVTTTDPDLLLSIAHHESRYTIARTAEPGNRVSCGVMTPIPKATCHSHSVADGYLEGARHLRDWLDVFRGKLGLALLAYAGGGGLVRACAKGAYWVRAGVNACDTPDVFKARARMIRLARARRPTAS